MALFLGLAGCAGGGGTAATETEEDLEGGWEALTASADAQYNAPGQRHNQVCVLYEGTSIPVRSDTGAGTGYSLPPLDDLGVPRPDLLKYLRDPGTSKEQCPDGSLRLDLQEMVKTPGGRTMVFHRGGYGFDDRAVIAQPPNDPVRGDTVHYGHVLLSDLNPHSQEEVEVACGARDATGRCEYGVQMNGKPCPELSTLNTIDPKPLPKGALWYYSRRYRGFIDYYVYADSAHLGAFQKPTRATLPLLWSWVTNREGTPNGGGGIERAVLKAGERFQACRGMKIKTRAYAWAAPPELGEPSLLDAGWVGAIYGRAESGLYGWAMYAYQIGENPVVTMMTRAVE